MPITTENTYLCTKSGTTYTKVVDIKDFPDLGSAPGTVDVTTLSDHFKKYEKGLIDTGRLAFTVGYDSATKTALAAQAGTEKTFAVVFGTLSGTTVTPVYGGVYFDGVLDFFTKGAGVEAAVEIECGITVNSDISDI